MQMPWRSCDVTLMNMKIFRWRTAESAKVAIYLYEQVINSCGLHMRPNYLYGLTLILPWMSNYIHYTVLDEITNPFPNFNGCPIEVWEGKSNFITHFIGHVITYPCWYWSETMLVKGASGRIRDPNLTNDINAVFLAASTGTVRTVNLWNMYIYIYIYIHSSNSLW